MDLFRTYYIFTMYGCAWNGNTTPNMDRTTESARERKQDCERADMWKKKKRNTRNSIKNRYTPQQQTVSRSLSVLFALCADVLRPLEYVHKLTNNCKAFHLLLEYVQCIFNFRFCSTFSSVCNASMHRVWFGFRWEAMVGLGSFSFNLWLLCVCQSFFFHHRFFCCVDFDFWFVCRLFSHFLSYTLTHLPAFDGVVLVHIDDKHTHIHTQSENALKRRHKIDDNLKKEEKRQTVICRNHWAEVSLVGAFDKWQENIYAIRLLFYIGI